MTVRRRAASRGNMHVYDAMCLVMSDSKEIDGTRLPLTQAVAVVLGKTTGTF
jgi:hypothetical protein